jgi:hypothetical protein
MFVNPLGVQADGLFDETRNVGDASWDGLWNSAGRITDSGFETEMRIPFSTLRFPDGQAERRWGMRLMRIRPRDYLYVYFDAPRPRGAACNLCTMGKLEAPRGIRGGRNLEIVPTLTLGYAQRREPGAWREIDGMQVEPGLDVAWTPSPSLTLGGTLNPDFSQVESDSARLDPTSNFALFFPEKRPFFLEGSDYFNMPLNAVYTRQIADPDVGLRATGRSGRHAYSTVVARDAVTTLLLPGVLGSELRVLETPNDALIGRYRYDLAGRASFGAIGTYRQGRITAMRWSVRICVGCAGCIRSMRSGCAANRATLQACASAMRAWPAMPAWPNTATATAAGPCASTTRGSAAVSPRIWASSDRSASAAPRWAEAGAGTARRTPRSTRSCSAAIGACRRARMAACWSVRPRPA